MNNKVEVSLLYDFYGQLLNESQRVIVEMCINDDLSLSEAGEILKISRQGVHDSLSRSIEKLNYYESKLGLCRDFKAKISTLDNINDTCDKIIDKSAGSEITEYAERIKKLVASLYEQGEGNGF